MAEEQARDVTRRAARDAEQLTEETEADLERRRETATRELDELRQSRLAELETLRAQSEQDAAAVAERTRIETEQLLAAARLAAEAVRAESEATARGLVEAAKLDADALRAAAEKDAGRVSQQMAEKRSRSLSELQAAQQEAHQSHVGIAGRGHRKAADRQRAPRPRRPSTPRSCGRHRWPRRNESSSRRRPRPSRSFCAPSSRRPPSMSGRARSSPGGDGRCGTNRSCWAAVSRPCSASSPRSAHSPPRPRRSCPRFRTWT